MVPADLDRADTRCGARYRRRLLGSGQADLDILRRRVELERQDPAPALSDCDVLIHDVDRKLGAEFAVRPTAADYEARRVLAHPVVCTVEGSSTPRAGLKLLWIAGKRRKSAL